MKNIFLEKDMNNIIEELNIYLKQDLGQVNNIYLAHFDPDSGHFVLALENRSLYEIYLRFNDHFENDDGFHKTFVVSVLNYQSRDQKTRDDFQIKALKKLVPLVEKYGYMQILYEGYAESVRLLAIYLGFKGYSSRMRSMKVVKPENNSDFYHYSISTLALKSKLEEYAA